MSLVEEHQKQRLRSWADEGLLVPEEVKVAATLER